MLVIEPSWIEYGTYELGAASVAWELAGMEEVPSVAFDGYAPLVIEPVYVTLALVLDAEHCLHYGEMILVHFYAHLNHSPRQVSKSWMMRQECMKVS